MQCICCCSCSSSSLILVVATVAVNGCSCITSTTENNSSRIVAIPTASRIDVVISVQYFDTVSRIVVAISIVVSVVNFRRLFELLLLLLLLLLVVVLLWRKKVDTEAAAELHGRPEIVVVFPLSSSSSS